MTVNLPPSVQKYFTAKNRRDFAVAVSGFAPSALVQDEGRDYTGPAAIRAWMEETAAKYDDRSAVMSAVPNGSGVEVLAEVSGTFPGSPVPLRFVFTLKDDLILGLRISP